MIELTVDQWSHGSRETRTRSAPSVGGTGPRRSLRSVMVRATVVPGTSQWLACSLHVKRFLPEDHNAVQLEVAQAARERRGRADKRRATRPGLQREHLRRPRVGIIMPRCRGSACGAHESVSSCICTPTPKLLSQRALLTVRRTCFVSGVERTSAVKGRTTRTIPSTSCRILGCLHCLLARFEAADMHSSIAAPSAAVASLPMMLH